MYMETNVKLLNMNLVANNIREFEQIHGASFWTPTFSHEWGMVGGNPGRV